jgi:hypothetical protein
MNEILDEDLNASFVRPEQTFKDNALAPYTEGSRLLLMQIRSDEDTSVYFVYAFIYIHILVHKDKKDAIKLCWNKEAFREKLMEWIADFNEKDREEATSLVGQILEDARKGQVEVVPTPQKLERGKF